jgi:hypothetical protein
MNSLKKILQYLALHPAFHLLFVLHCFALYERENYLVQKFLPRSPVPYFFEGLTSFSKADFFWWLNALRAMPTSFSVFTPPFTSRNQCF